MDDYKRQYKKGGVYSMTETQIIAHPSHLLEMMKEGIKVHVGELMFMARSHFKKKVYYPTRINQIDISRASLCSYKGCKNRAIVDFCKEHRMFEQPFKYDR